MAAETQDSDTTDAGDNIGASMFDQGIASLGANQGDEKDWEDEENNYELQSPPWLCKYHHGHMTAPWPFRTEDFVFIQDPRDLIADIWWPKNEVPKFLLIGKDDGLMRERMGTRGFFGIKIHYRKLACNRNFWALEKRMAKCPRANAYYLSYCRSDIARVLTIFMYENVVPYWHPDTTDLSEARFYVELYRQGLSKQIDRLPEICLARLAKKPRKETTDGNIFDGALPPEQKTKQRLDEEWKDPLPRHLPPIPKRGLRIGQSPGEARDLLREVCFGCFVTGKNGVDSLRRVRQALFHGCIEEIMEHVDVETLDQLCDDGKQGTTGFKYDLLHAVKDWILTEAQAVGYGLEELD